MRTRRAVKVSPGVADQYRVTARLRGVDVSALMVEELHAAEAEVHAGRGHLLPRAPRPGRLRDPGQPTAPAADQFKVSMDGDEFQTIARLLASVGSSPTAVLRNPRHIQVDVTEPSH